MLIRKLFKAEMAHATWGAYSKRCHHVHGHSYKFEIFLRSHTPNPAQMVADFKAVKDIGINDFLDSFDHALMVWEKDPRAPLIQKINPERHILVPFIPTAEMMAKAFFVVCQAILETGPALSGEKDVFIDHVIIHETDTGYAEFGIKDAEDDRFADIDFNRWIFSAGIQAAWANRDWFEKAKAQLGLFAKPLKITTSEPA